MTPSAPRTSADLHRLLRRSLWGLAAWREDGVDGLHFVSLDPEGGNAIDVVVDEQHLPFLSALFLGTERVFVCADAKPLLRWLLRRGLDVARPLCVHTLNLLAKGDLIEQDPRTGPADDVFGHRGGSPEVVGDRGRAHRRAKDALLAVEPLLGRLDDGGERRVARLECLVTRAFAGLEHRGLPIDFDRWRALVDDEKQAAATAKARIFEVAGDLVPRDLFGVAELNLDAEFEVRKLLERATGRTLESTGKAVLASLEHPLADAILAFREPWKIVTTYGDAFLEHVGDIPADADVEGRRIGRLRSTFIPLGASTGRVACRDPNLQNLPKDQRFHDALRAPRGRVLVTADYATCELRIVAELAEDPVFVAAFDRGEDLHSTVASTMFGKPVSKTVNPDLRQRAKAINFGLVYGMGPGALASSLGVDRAAGEALLAQYFKTFPRIRDYLDCSVDVALRRGYSETILGRKLRYPAEQLRADNARGEFSRIMKNMPIQGTSADMTKLAMVRIHERLGGLGRAGLVNTVHDELVVECDAADGDTIARLVEDEMSEAHRTLLRRVPPSVEVHVGPVWAH